MLIGAAMVILLTAGLLKETESKYVNIFQNNISRRKSES